MPPTVPGDNVPLTISYKEDEEVVQDGKTVLIGSDAASTIRIVRPGISRKHAVVSFDGDTWKVEDAGSRNGIFADGQRIQTVIIESPTTLYLGHPTDGEAILFVPAAASTSEPSIQDEINAFVITDPPKTAPVSADRTTSAAPPSAETTRIQPAAASGASDAELAALTAALRDQISSVKGLTWSVWAMIAVTATLAVMTLFVGILGS
jgi:hypothetical protein